LVGYVVRYRVGTDAWAEESLAADTTAATLGGLQPGATYTVQVAARNANGLGPWTASMTAKTATGPGPVGTLGVSAVTSGLRVSWKAPSFNGGVPVTGYRVEVRPEGAGDAAWAGPEFGVTTSTTISPLEAAYKYEVRVAARNGVGLGSWSQFSVAVAPGSPSTPPAPVTATPPAPVTVPSAPQGVNVASASSSTPTDAQATITWSPPKSNGGAALSGYTVTVSPGGQSQNTTGTSLTLNGLKPGTQYTFSVVARNSVGPSSAGTATVVPPSPTVGVAVKPVKSNGKLFVDVNPDEGSGYWKFKVLYKTKTGSWKAYSKTYKTSGSRETRTLNFRKGTYRVAVTASYGYLGTESSEVVLTK
jgi:hypothetical protein